MRNAIQPVQPKRSQHAPDEMPKNMAHTDEGVPENTDDIPYWKLGETKQALDYVIIGTASGKNLLDEGYDIVEANAAGRWLVHKVRNAEGVWGQERVEGVDIRIRRKR